MGGIQRRKANVAKNKLYRKARKTKRKTRDIDQVYDDMHEEQKKVMDREKDEDLPGGGQFYCIPCSRHFLNQVAVDTHMKSKEHKKRYKIATKQPPHTQYAAEYYAGLGID